MDHEGDSINVGKSSPPRRCVNIKQNHNRNKY